MIRSRIVWAISLILFAGCIWQSQDQSISVRTLSINGLSFTFPARAELDVIQPFGVVGREGVALVKHDGKSFRELLITGTVNPMQLVTGQNTASWKSLGQLSHGESVVTVRSSNVIVRDIPLKRVEYRIESDVADGPIAFTFTCSRSTDSSVLNQYLKSVLGSEPC